MEIADREPWKNALERSKVTALSFVMRRAQPPLIIKDFSNFNPNAPHQCHPLQAVVLSLSMPLYCE